MKLLIDNKLVIINEYNTYLKKLKGLMGVKKKISYGIRINNCKAIHTFFMKQNIDICITNKDNIILYLKSNVSNNKIIGPIKKGYYTYELPLGTVNNLKIGDALYYENPRI